MKLKQSPLTITSNKSSLFARQSPPSSVDMRKKSVQSIEKITKSMKMVSAAKFARAERALKEAIAIGPSSTVATDKVCHMKKKC